MPGSRILNTLHFSWLAISLSALISPLSVISGSTPDYWAIESAEARRELPLFKTTPAARPEELTPANGHPLIKELNWERSHGGDENLRFAPGTQLDRENVDQLEVAWTYNAGGADNIQCNPIVANGLLFTPVPGDALVAVNAANGKEVWRYQPQFEKTDWFIRTAFRGLTFERADGKNILLFCAGDSCVVLNADDGTEIRMFRTGFFVVAPILFEGKVIIAGFDKDVTAFDFETGEQVWNFHTLPRPGDAAADTWDRVEKGANVWGGMAFDRERGIIYVATGSPKPNFIGVHHRGDNLYGNCVLAIDARSGEKRWHFQEIPHDIWDMDIPSPPILVTIKRDGQRIDAVAALSKTGNTLLLDRLSGKPIFPFRWRRAPVSDLPGEVTAPYQPDVELPERFARRGFRIEDVTNRSEEARNYILDIIQKSKWGDFAAPSLEQTLVLYGFHGGAEWTGGCANPRNGRIFVSSNELPWFLTLNEVKGNATEAEELLESPGRRIYENTCAACHGNNREGLAVNPPLKLVGQRLSESGIKKVIREGRNLMPAMSFLSDADLDDLVDYLIRADEKNTTEEKTERPNYSFNGYVKLLDQEGYPGCKPPWGTLNCLDLNTGKLVWQVPLGEYENLIEQGIPITGTENFGGPSMTASGLVFCSGTRDKMIRAFDAETGEELWKHELPCHGSGPPTIYQIDGKPYVVISATGGGKLGKPVGDTFVAFSLPFEDPRK